MNRKRIVINALQYKGNCSGLGILLRELFGRVAQHFDGHCTVILPKGSPEYPAGNTAELVLAPCTYEEGLKRMVFQSLVMGRRFCRNALLLTTDSKLPFLLPDSVTVLPIITDLALFRMPEVYQASRALLWKLQYRTLLRKAVRYVAISEFTKNEMTKLLGISEDRISVAYCAARDDFWRETDEKAISILRRKYQLPQHFVLFVGSLNPRKNLIRLIKAFDQMKQNTELPHELVIAGDQGWKFNAEEALADIAAKDAIHFIGYVSDNEMPALYSAAELFAFPTLYEGFGIPVIEAQQCGTAVLTSNTSALPEVGGDAAFYVDPYDEADIQHGMTELLKNEALRAELIQKGFQNAKRFSWEKSAQKLNEIIEGYLQ